tara:strand:+ start:432 stop:695 length:264 start_codon:yes stop_codon:yes gene_type:complete
MKYQLWDMVSYAHGEPMMPCSLLKESNSFELIHSEFIKNKGMSVILIKDNKKTLEIDHTKKIYESPDGGRTIYERDFGDYTNRRKLN